MDTLQTREPVVIGLAGKMRTGKDTIARLMSQVKRGSFHRAAYGDELKSDYHEKHGFPTDGKARKGYQDHGQAERKKDPLVWVKKLDSTLVILRELMGQNVVITDVRQPNEVEHIRKMGGYIIRVNVDDEIRLARMNAKGDNFTQADLVHETEMSIDTFDVDYELTNNEGITELVHQLDPILLDIDRRWREGE
jgi:dephospho-CoA kinase